MACTSTRVTRGRSVKPDFDSASAEQLDVEELKALLLTVPEIRTELIQGWSTRFRIIDPSLTGT